MGVQESCCAAYVTDSRRVRFSPLRRDRLGACAFMPVVGRGCVWRASAIRSMSDHPRSFEQRMSRAHGGGRFDVARRTSPTQCPHDCASQTQPAELRVNDHAADRANIVIGPANLSAVTERRETEHFASRPTHRRRPRQHTDRRHGLTTGVVVNDRDDASPRRGSAGAVVEARQLRVIPACSLPQEQSSSQKVRQRVGG